MVSCWEVAKLVENNHLQFHCTVNKWLEQALNYPGIRMLELTLPIILNSTQLPQPFHREPADQLIVATARVRFYRIIFIVFYLYLLTQIRQSHPNFA